MRQRLGLPGFALQRDQRLRVTAKLDVQNLDRDVRLAIGRLQLAQVQRLVHRPHAAEADAFFQHEAAIQCIADALYALRLRDCLVVDRTGR